MEKTQLCSLTIKVVLTCGWISQLTRYQSINPNCTDHIYILPSVESVIVEKCQHIGQGFCGSVWAAPIGTFAITRKDGWPGRSVHNGYVMYRKVLQSLFARFCMELQKWTVACHVLHWPSSQLQAALQSNDVYTVSKSWRDAVRPPTFPSSLMDKFLFVYWNDWKCRPDAIPDGNGGKCGETRFCSINAIVATISGLTPQQSEW